MGVSSAPQLLQLPRNTIGDEICTTAVAATAFFGH